MKFKIGKRYFNIKFVNKIDEEDSWGFISHSDRIIKIKKTNNTEERITLLHEMIHAIFYSLGHREQKEKLVHALAEKLYEILLDNKDIFKYVYDK